jgi:hypothetical protein
MEREREVAGKVGEGEEWKWKNLTTYIHSTIAYINIYISVTAIESD